MNASFHVVALSCLRAHVSLPVLAVTVLAAVLPLSNSECGERTRGARDVTSSLGVPVNRWHLCDRSFV